LKAEVVEVAARNITAWFETELHSDFLVAAGYATIYGKEAYRVRFSVVAGK